MILSLMSEDITDAPLVVPLGSASTNCVSAASGVPAKADTDLRRYTANLQTSAKLHGHLDVGNRAIVWNVGRRGGAGAGLEAPGDEVSCYEIGFTPVESHAVDAHGMASKFSAFPSRWSFMDFSGLCERLMCAMAHFANHGTLTTAQIRGGKELNVVALGSLVRPISAGRGDLFLGAEASSITTPGIICAMANAMSGCGGRLVLDAVELQAGTNSVLVEEASDEALAYGCFYAWALLMANLKHNKVGSQGVYASTRGVHGGTTVYGHTDEGSYTRDVLRRSRFGVPCGAVLLKYPDFTSCGAPKGGLASWQRFIDGIALSTAAAAQVSDPLVAVNGKMYPTIFSFDGPDVEAGLDVKGTDEMAISHGRSYASNATRFGAIYLKSCCDLFGVEDNDSRSLAHFAACANDLVGVAKSHLRHSTVAPYTWIESTGLIDLDAVGRPAVAEGYGPLTAPGRVKEMPYFSGSTMVSQNVVCSHLAVDWRAARKHGLLQHLTLHARDGLANIRLKQLDPSRMTLCGSPIDSDAGKSMSDMMLDGHDVSDMLWGRGHSGAIAPAEMLYTGNRVLVQVMCASLGEDGDEFTELHAPTAEDMSGEVRITVSMPMPISNGKLKDKKTRVSRDRSKAAKALKRARIAVGNISGGYVDVAVSFVDFCIGGDEPSAFSDTPGSNATAEAAGSVVSSTPAIAEVTVAAGARAGPTVRWNSTSGPGLARHDGRHSGASNTTPGAASAQNVEPTRNTADDSETQQETGTESADTVAGEVV